MYDTNCINCFAQLNGSAVCPRCGFDHGAYVPQPHHLRPGTVLQGRYVVGRAMGQGGFGITYAGFDPNMDRRVAIKEFYPNGVASRDASRTDVVTCTGTGDIAENFRLGVDKCVQEARSLAQLDDIPGVVRGLDQFQMNNTAYIIMEFVQGVTLREYLRQRLPHKPDFREAVELLAPIGKALQRVHERGFVHRDVSPDNIMINTEGEPKLLDFGAVKMVVSDDGGQTEHPIVKRGFSPIEMYSTDGRIGPWSDVYAYCATLYFILVGSSADEPANRIYRDTLGGKLANVVSPAQSSVLEKGMALSPQNRYQKMAELLPALAACKADRKPMREQPERTPAPEAERIKQPTPVQDPAKTVLINSGTESPAAPARTMKAPPREPVQESEALPQRVPATEQKTSPLPTPSRPAPTGKAPAQPPAASKKKKKAPVFAAVIAAVVVLSIIIGVVVSRLQPLASASVGDYVKFGSYEQDNDTTNGKEDIEWLVLAKENGKALLISRYGLDCQPYNTEYTSVTWETCTLRTWLNDTFLNDAFSADEQSKIPYSTVTADGNPKFDTDPGNDTTDKIFLLSITEAERYFSSDEARKCQPTKYAKGQGVWTNDNGCCWWWLRSPGNYSYSAAIVLHGGSDSSNGNFVHVVAVRPALWINLNS